MGAEKGLCGKGRHWMCVQTIRRSLDAREREERTQSRIDGAAASFVAQGITAARWHARELYDFLRHERGVGGAAVRHCDFEG
jgi:hypothetical protein